MKRTTKPGGQETTGRKRTKVAAKETTVHPRKMKNEKVTEQGVEIVIPEVEPMRLDRLRWNAYDPDAHPKRMYELAQLGLTHEQLAKGFGVGREVLSVWLRKYPEFRDAWEDGRDIFDYSVEQSMAMRAKGFEYVEKRRIDGVDALGRPYNYTTETTKYVPPDTTAAIFWLKNRHATRWQDVNRQEIVGTNSVEVNHRLKLDKLSEEERKLLQGLTIKQLASGDVR